MGAPPGVDRGGAGGDVLRVLVVDDDPWVLRTLAREIGHSCEVVVAAGARAALVLVDEAPAPPNAVVVDLRLGDGPDGIALLREVRQRLGWIPACLFTGADAVDVNSFDRFAGLRPVPWFAPKPHVLDELRRFLETAPTALLIDLPDSKLLAEVVVAEAKARNLPPRERQVLALVTRGDRTEVIASKLRVQRSTIETHLRSLRGKLGLERTRDLRDAMLERARAVGE